MSTLNLPSFVPVPCHIRVLESGDETYQHLEVEFDELFANDIQALHKSNVVIFHQDEWCNFKEKVRSLEDRLSKFEVQA